MTPSNELVRALDAVRLAASALTPPSPQTLYLALKASFSHDGEEAAALEREMSLIQQQMLGHLARLHAMSGEFAPDSAEDLFAERPVAHLLARLSGPHPDTHSRNGASA